MSTPSPPSEHAAEHLAHGALLVDLAHAVDQAAGARVVVFGSPPPDGRDLDLLAREPQQRAVEACLSSQGMPGKRGKWVAFRNCAAAGVELVPAADWRLPRSELDALFAEAEPLRGFSHLAVPAPHHSLIIAARRAARAGRYDDRLRARVAAACATPAAWREAELRAAASEATGSLVALRAMHEGARPRLTDRMRATAARLRAVRAPRRRAAARAVRRLIGRPVIVALSGLDGAGKSFQASRLQLALEQLGFAAEVIWPPAANVLFQANPALKRRLFALLGALGRRAEPEAAKPTAGNSADSYPRPLPRQHGPIVHLLAVLVALSQAWAFRRGARRARRGTDVLIYDRYALDSIVYLRHRWGQGRELRVQGALIRLLTTRPHRAFFLEVAPEVAYARKQDFPLQNLRERAALYSALHEQLECVRLDGEHPPQRICADIARAVWECLT